LDFQDKFLSSVDKSSQFEADKPEVGAMGASNLFNEYRLTGMVLILAFISFAIGAALPTVGKNGNMEIFTLPIREHLLAVASIVTEWRWGNVFMGAAAVIQLAGLSVFTTTLEGVNERVFSRLGLIGLLLTTVFWLIFSAFRTVITVIAAQEIAATSAVPTYYEPIEKLGFAIFYIYAVSGFLALAAYGGSLLKADLLPVWVGWVTLLFSIGMLILLLIMSDTLPAFHYLSALLIGILLLLHS
jgi:hypothetical protein